MFPYDIVIPIYGTDISIIKRKGLKTEITLKGLSEPIPFMLPAKIAFEYLSYISYDFVLSTLFDPFRSWTESNNFKYRVVINTELSNITDFSNIHFGSYHYIRFSVIDNNLLAIVCLFGWIKFSVFLGGLKYGIEFPNPDLLDVYSIFDFKNKQLLLKTPPQDIFDMDTMYLKGIKVLAKYYFNQNEH